MINALFISRRKEVHLGGHSVYRPAKENAFLLFFIIFLIPKVKELIALVTEQAINAENLRRKQAIKGLLFQSSSVKVIKFILFDPETLFTFHLPRLTLLPYF